MLQLSRFMFACVEIEFTLILRIYFCILINSSLNYEQLFHIFFALQLKC